ncbi:DNA primase [Candidatus Uhrbacteria bacterium]|nr:DNA primase [Candidatus Uhrbacteria bacterium]MBD3283837.1 DNA primase [Candidatus Uhrbacteria bacterium]
MFNNNRFSSLPTYPERILLAFEILSVPYPLDPMSPEMVHGIFIVQYLYSRGIYQQATSRVIIEVMEPVEEVKSHLDIVDIVGEYLQLKPAGTASFKACCPFHQENTPSFFVNRNRQSWHCFGCDKGGDLISFVMDMEGMGFRDALGLLATKAGVKLPDYNPEQTGKKQRLYEVNDLAARFFRAQLLQAPQAQHARDYAAKRGIDELTGDLFKIGYAPQSWNALTNALKSKGVTEQELLDAGLVGKSQKGSGVYDRFRDRLMFTITDVHGNAVGFTGRLLNSDAKEAKYVNTPETMVYKKSAVLYGLDKAKGEMKSKDLCVIVEGNMDALSSHKAGTTNVVASSGTALTAEQLKLIQRFTKNLSIAFDADAAGGSATLRGLDLARTQDFQIKIIMLPEDAGKDPDDVIMKDPKIWEQAIKEAKDIMDWVFQTAHRGKNLSDPNHKREIAKLILPEIKRIADPIVKDHWIKKLAESLQTSEQALRDALSKTKSEQPANQNRNEPKEEPLVVKQKTRGRDLAERLLGLLLSDKELFNQLPPDFEVLIDDELSTIYKCLQNTYLDDHSMKAPRPAEPLPDNTQRLMNELAIRVDRDYPNQTHAERLQTFRSTLDVLRKEHRQETRKRLEEDMRAAELSGDRAKIEALAKRFHELT